MMEIYMSGTNVWSMLLIFSLMGFAFGYIYCWFKLMKERLNIEKHKESQTFMQNKTKIVGDK